VKVTSFNLYDVKRNLAAKEANFGVCCRNTGRGVGR